jgi:hypothetical protein
MITTCLISIIIRPAVESKSDRKNKCTELSQVQRERKRMLYIRERVSCPELALPGANPESIHVRGRAYGAEDHHFIPLQLTVVVN